MVPCPSSGSFAATDCVRLDDGLRQFISFHTPVTEIDRRPLTKREQQIVDLVLRGATNREIAHKLGISEHTVKVRMGKLFAKLGVKSRLQLAMRAFRR